MSTCLLILTNSPPTHIFLLNRIKNFQLTRLLCPQVYLVYITKDLCNSWKNNDLLFFSSHFFLLALQCNIFCLVMKNNLQYYELEKKYTAQIKKQFLRFFKWPTNRIWIQNPALWLVSYLKMNAHPKYENMTPIFHKQRYAFIWYH